MTIEKKIENDGAVLAVSGRLDTVTAPALEAALDEIFGNIKALILDFSELEYISSAGLRVILKAQKAMTGKGSMKLIGVNDNIREVFEITGFTDILTIE